MSAGKAYRSRWATPAAVCCLTTIALLLRPAPAAAVQIHGAPEGLYVHQMSHLFFAAALVFLLYILHRRPLGTGPAWRFFKLSLAFFLAWNIETLLVHWLSLRLPDTAVVGASLWSRRLAPPLDWERWLYYLGLYDHLLCLPGMFFFVLSLRHFCAQAEAETDERHRRWPA